MKRGGDLGKVRFGSHRSFEIYRETDAMERREVGEGRFIHERHFLLRRVKKETFRPLFILSFASQEAH